MFLPLKMEAIVFFISPIIWHSDVCMDTKRNKSRERQRRRERERERERERIIEIEKRSERAGDLWGEQNREVGSRREIRKLDSFSYTVHLMIYLRTSMVNRSGDVRKDSWGNGHTGAEHVRHRCGCLCPSIRLVSFSDIEHKRMHVHSNMTKSFLFNDHI